MKTITITAEANAALMAQADAPWDHGYHRNPDGTYEVSVDDEVIAELNAIKHPSETYSDVIVRMAATLPKDGSTRRSYQ